MSGPVSTLLEQELADEIRRQGIVVWLDKDAHYTAFVRGLEAKQASGETPFPVVGFRGSFLELLFKLEPYGSGLDKHPLLVHMPGFNEESIRKTPLLELYAPGFRFRKALDTLIREAATARMAPAEVDAFLAGKPTLEAADAWLVSAASQSTFGLGAKLSEFGPRMLADALSDPGGLAPDVATPEGIATLASYVHRLTGMDTAWEAFYQGDAKAKPLDRILHQLGGWILSVEYVHDLRRPAHNEHLRRLKSLSIPLVKACGDLCAQIRRDHGDAYERLANEVEGFLEEELSTMTADDLGQIDTFRKEATRVLTGAVDALRKGEFAKAKAWCDARQGGKSFWLQREQPRRWEWTLVGDAADLGARIAEYPRPLAGARSLDEAAERYASGAYKVDFAHRKFEQRRLALLESRLPHYSALREVASELRRAHRTWADQLARDFSQLCKDHGFLPSPELQQRTLYEQTVHPLTRTGEKVAVFLIDAFRFEMATELASELGGPGAIVSLKPRLAELPTLTSVGMNALAPVVQGGKLLVDGVFQGFKTGEYTVRKPEDRSRSMGMRSSQKPALLLKLAEVCDAHTEDLIRKVKPHALVVVHSRAIDDAGEANVGLPTFESTLRQIKAAWHHLQLAGVKSCVFTADHGFLLQDETTEIRPFGRKADPQRRHVLDEHPRAEPGMLPVSVSSLGYEGISGYLLFREDTAVFATGNSGASFVHGGNSPQERVIPVLTVTRKRAEQGGYSEYAIEVEPLPDVMGSHRLRLRIGFAKETTASLGFAAAGTIDLGVRVPDRDPRYPVRVVFKDLAGPGELKLGRLKVPVGEAWTEVFFGLEGDTDERVRLEVHHPDNIENVQSAIPEQWYAVSGTASASTARGASSPAPPLAWGDAIGDEGVRRAFLHIETHGRVTEVELAGPTMLGSPRAVRRFSGELESYFPKLPFRVRVEINDAGKVYIREGDR